MTRHLFVKLLRPPPIFSQTCDVFIRLSLSLIPRSAPPRSHTVFRAAIDTCVSVFSLIASMTFSRERGFRLRPLNHDCPVRGGDSELRRFGSGGPPSILRKAWSFAITPVMQAIRELEIAALAPVFAAQLGFIFGDALPTDCAGIESGRVPVVLLDSRMLGIGRNCSISTPRVR